jgi:tRNA(Ile)-lysidine synthase
VRDAGRRTLIACSGGADSSALLLALSAVSPGPEVCHVVHDMRSAAEARADADRTRALCASLGVTYHERSVAVPASGENAESAARALRYAALGVVARERGLRFVATGHHADDQLETLLMRMLRGAGVRGMAGIRATRLLDGGDDGSVTVVRPMLGVSHAEAVGLCERCGWAWNEDATNRDERRLRAALRARVLPALRSVEPDAAARASRTAASLASADEAIGAWAGAVLAGATVDEHADLIRLEYERFVELPDSVIVSLLRLIYTRIVGKSGLDRLSQAFIRDLIRGLRGADGLVSRHDLAEIELRISEGWIEFCKK